MLKTAMTSVMVYPGLESHKSGRVVWVGIKMLVHRIDRDGYYILFPPIPSFSVNYVISLSIQNLMYLLAHVPVLPGAASWR